MLLTLVQKEVMHHLLSIRFVALLLMCLLLIPLTLSTGYNTYLQNQINYQELLKLAHTEIEEIPQDIPGPDIEVTRLFLKPSPLSPFSKGLEHSLPSYLGMTLNGIKHGAPVLAEASLSSALGNLDFLFVVSTVFSLLALLFTFDSVAGEREAGTLRIILANPVPRHIFLLSKLIGGYFVFIIPFLVSAIVGLLLLAWQGFPFDAPEISPRVFLLILISLVYIAIFFALGLMVSTYLDSVKTALMVVFTIWVLAVLIAPRIGFLSAKLIAPTRPIQSVYMEKTVIRNNINEEKKEKLAKAIIGALGNRIAPDMKGKILQIRKPIDEEFQQKFREQSSEIDLEYQREKDYQESIGEIFSRITPVSSLIYVAMNLADTGKLKRDIYFQIGVRYHNQLSSEYFNRILDDDFAQMMKFLGETTDEKNKEKITPPPEIKNATLSETLHHTVLDLLMFCFALSVFLTVAFLKFSHTDI